ncbi:MAG: hypothetical protein JKY34_08810, partial [Kordiimonadaceae bacterium]|nr:hypothetical protein [Kordiimonadaceae bacterium]
MSFTVTEAYPRVRYEIGNTEESYFTIPNDWTFFEASEIEVYVDGKQLTTGEYAVSGANGDGGGTVTVLNPVRKADVLLRRDVKSERTTNFPNSGPFDVEVLNDQLNRLVLAQQDLEAEVGRTLRFSHFSFPENVNALGDVFSRQGRILGFDNSGQPFAGPTVEDVAWLVDTARERGFLAAEFGPYI